MEEKGNKKWREEKREKEGAVLKFLYHEKIWLSHG
jgi:hypothetical protein